MTVQTKLKNLFCVLGCHYGETITQKKFYNALLVLLAFYINVQRVSAQKSLNIRTKQIAVEMGRSITLDSLSIDSASFSITLLNGTKCIAEKDYAFSWYDSKLNWLKDGVDSVLVEYVALPINFSESHHKLSRSLISYNTNSQSDAFTIKPKSTTGNESELNRTGSITRGISVGNNQNMYVNSSLDLQLSGELADGVMIKAALNDRNLPIQPEGTSAQIQEFDNVFIEVSSAKSKLILGDFLLQNQPNGYFFKTYKKAQGAYLQTEVLSTQNHKIQAGGSYSIARGKFSRNVFNGEEGNQGPYRLTGPNGELFIIIVAGSERVYINGETLQRGEDYDYVIDYNIGEITFTPNRLITQFDRIIIEFQYTDNSYERSIANVFAHGSGEKFSWSINHYAENDNRNKAFFTTLTNEDKTQLALAGDNYIGTLKPSEVAVNEGYSGVVYVKKDTLVSGQLFRNIYEPATQNDSGIVRLTFTYLGPNKGNYIESNQSINGRRYVWKAPVNGVPQGLYEPVVQLIAPQGKTLTTAGGSIKLSKRNLILAEAGLSRTNLNRFSSLDSDDDLGYSFRVESDNKNLFSKSDSTKWQTNVNVNYEYKSANFSPIERYRSVEFERNWNRQISNSSLLSSLEQEHLFNSSITVNNQSKSRFSIGTSAFKRGDIFTGQSYFANASLNGKSLSFNSINNLVNSQNVDSTYQFGANFFQSHQQIEKHFGKTDVYVGFGLEENLFGTNLDSLGNNSNGYRQWVAGIKSPDSLVNEYALEYRQKWVMGIWNSKYAPLNVSSDYKALFGFNKSARNRLRVQMNYRTLQPLVNDSNQQLESTLLGRIEYGLTGLKGLMRTTSYYQIGTGRERQFEIVYSKIGAGQGTYVWNDLNNNGLEELGEFRVQDYNGQGEYVRLILNNNQYVPAVSNEFSQNLSIQPAALFGGKSGLKSFVARFNNVSVASIRRKTRDANQLSQFNPFVLNTNSEYLVSTLSQLRNTLTFNRLGNVFSFDYVTAYLSGKNLFTFGFESQEKWEHIANVRFLLSKTLQFLPTYKYGYTLSRSEAFTNKNYNLNAHQLNAKLSWQNAQKIRVSGIYEYYSGANLIYKGNEVATKNTVGIETNYTPSISSYMTANFNMVNIAYSGELNTPIAFVMLQSLRPGVNFTWQGNVNFNLSENTSLSIIYEGRKSEETRTIHTGSVNIRWLF
ncbi:MAG: hypothetical protein KDC92_04425 [Bacteroidetes bacterium]|nr:hypothetical protein [Bacteroidota bacterium]